MHPTASMQNWRVDQGSSRPGRDQPQLHCVSESELVRNGHNRNGRSVGSVGWSVFVSVFARRAHSSCMSGLMKSSFKVGNQPVVWERSRHLHQGPKFSAKGLHHPYSLSLLQVWIEMMRVYTCIWGVGGQPRALAVQLLLLLCCLGRVRGGRRVANRVMLFDYLRLLDGLGRGRTRSLGRSRTARANK